MSRSGAIDVHQRSAQQLAQECVLRCREIATISEVQGQTTRRYLTPPMRKVHAVISDWMQASQMAVRTDNAGNLIGRRSANLSIASEETPAPKTLLLGSHLDTVPNAGAFDGVLGVMIGLAVIELLEKTPLPFHVDVVGFSEEEGVRFSTPYIGSSAIAGCFDSTMLDRSDGDAKTMHDAICEFGLNPGNVAAAAYSPAEVIGFVEAHIEQGPLLGHLDRSVAWVDHIAGQSRLGVRFSGCASHAGTTPMTLRQDALLAASRWVALVNEYAIAIEGLRATVGCMDVSPNVRNVVPDRVDLTVDIRHAYDDVREKAVHQLCERASQIASDANVAFQVVEQQSQPAAQMEPAICERLKRAMQSCGYPDASMISGAGHDAVVMASAFPTTMLLIRQDSGISHHPDESVEAVDVAAAIEVLKELALQIASDQQ